ncbi:MAG: hypothetical protein QXG51_07635, partial [Nitrososphaerota archaeon]
KEWRHNLRRHMNNTKRTRRKDKRRMEVIMDALTIGITLYDPQNIIKEAREKSPNTITIQE